MPRSKSRAKVRSPISSGRSRWAMPSGPLVVRSRLSLSHDDSRSPRFMPMVACTGRVICMATKTTPTVVSAPPRDRSCSTARTRLPMATTKTAGSAPARTRRAHHAPASPRLARGNTAKNFQGSEPRRRSITLHTRTRTAHEDYRSTRATHRYPPCALRARPGPAPVARWERREERWAEVPPREGPG